MIVLSREQYQAHGFNDSRPSLTAFIPFTPPVVPATSCILHYFPFNR